MSFTEKILQYSNSYKFYKKNYEKLTIKSKTQEKEIKKLKKELEELNQDLEPYIKVESIKIKDNKVNYKFKTSPKLDKYFNKKSMFIEVEDKFKDN